MKLSRNCNGKEKYTLCKVYNNHRVHGNRIILLSQPNMNREGEGSAINHEEEVTLHDQMNFVTSIDTYGCYRRDRKRDLLFLAFRISMIPLLTHSYTWSGSLNA